MIQQTVTVDDIDLIKEELLLMKDLFMRVIQIVPDFDIADSKILPYGLKPHTRSVSWIVEQVIVQKPSLMLPNWV